MMNLLTGLWGKILAVLAIVSAALAAIALLRKGGADAERAKQLEKIMSSQKTSDDIRRRLDRMPDGELERLRQSWTRPR